MSKKGYTLVLKELQEGIDNGTNGRACVERKGKQREELRRIGGRIRLQIASRR